MKIVKWLSNPNSSIIGDAVIEVLENEQAIVEDMLSLIDGDSVGHFGIRVKLVGTTNQPEYYKDNKGYWNVKPQFGYDNASILETKKRYFEVTVSRD